jgi:protoheme ferro-lyase
LDWSEPDVTDTVRHLAALGCETVLVVPASMPVESLGTLVDVRQAARFARVPVTTSVEVLDAWGRDPVLIEELASRVREAMRG